MTRDHLDLDGLFRRWVRATSAGWLLGLAILIVLAVLGDMLSGLAPANAQYMVGVGIGAGVGYMQGRVLSPWLERPNRWILASTVGMGALFVAHDIIGATGFGFPFSLPVYVLVGAVLAGSWQRSLLRHVSERANWWVPVSVVGWALPAAGVALSDFQRSGFVGDVAGLVAIFFGGVLLGVASGRPLVWILRRPTA